MRWPHLCVGLCLVAVLVGCGSTDDRRQVRVVVESFYDAVEREQGAQACARLSAATVEELESQERKPCADAVTALELEGGEIVDSEVFITNARVVLGSGENAFLAHEPGGWKLSAVGCTFDEGKPRDRPADCQVEA